MKSSSFRFKREWALAARSAAAGMQPSSPGRAADLLLAALALWPKRVGGAASSTVSMPAQTGG